MDSLLSWVEVEDCYLTDERNTSVTMFCWECKRVGKKIVRTRFTEELRASCLDDLDEQIVEFCAPHLLIPSPSDPHIYQFNSAEPTVISQTVI